MSEQLPSLLRAVLDEVHRLAQNLQLKTTDRQHLLSGALLGRTLEIAEGVCSMLARQDSACSLILLRSLLEVYVDLRNLVEDPDYAEFIHANWLNQQKRGLEKAQKNSGRLMARIGDADEAEKHLDYVHSTLQELKKRGITPLTIESRFQRAGELDLYDRLYAPLSWNSHNNLNVLEARHVRGSDSGFEIQVFAPISEHEAAKASDTTAGIAANALVAVRSLVQPDAGKKGLSQLDEKLELLRENVREVARAIAAEPED